MRAYEIVSPDGIDALNLADRPDPAPGPGEVAVRMHASSLNYRDYLTVTDPGGRNLPYPRVPNSDGAGEVIAVGDGVSRVKVGDRVASTFFRNWVCGGITADAMASALGGALDGVLAEQVILSAEGCVPVPEHMSYAEAATLPCAALTAWHSVIEVGRIRAGETVLLIGTGGVSIFGLQFAAMHGARPIVLSSSDAKLERATQMGAWQTINYKQYPQWADKVLELTDGRGVDHTVEVGGAGTLEQSVAATRVGGSIGMIGVLTGGTVSPTLVMRKSLRLQGIYVGSRAMFESMNTAIGAHQLNPVIDQTFAFDDARAAYHCMEAAGHFGKIVVNLAD